MNDEEFEQWQEQRNAAVYATLMELLSGVAVLGGIDRDIRSLVLDCKKMLEDFDK